MNKVNNGITVNGIFEYPIQPEYCIKMVLSLQNINFERPTATYNDIREEYMEKLVDEGIAGKPGVHLKEDPLAYSLMGYEMEGNIIEYKTKSLQMAQKFLSIKSDGVFKSESVMWIEHTNEEQAKYNKKAFENAKEKALTIALNLGKQLGDVLSIEDTNPKKYIDGLYHTDNLKKREYHIRVSFEMI